MEEIIGDLFDVCNKLKHIDNNYVLFRNKKKSRFEVYYKCGLNLDLQLVLPFERLDFRTIDLVYKTRVQNADKIFKEIDEINLKRGA